MSHKVYFASDLHLGSPTPAESRKREKRFIEWLDKASSDATEIHLLGDIFDFWFEYRNSVPKGGARVLGAIARVTDSGIPVHFHVGNHDLWTFGYLEEELGVVVHSEPLKTEWDGLTCLVSHGDGLGPGDYTYKWIKKIYNNRICRLLFRFMHPDLGISLARRLSKNSRAAGGRTGGEFQSAEKEDLYNYCVDYLKQDSSIDCFIMGHRHIPLDLEIQREDPENSRYINVGDWTKHFSWAVLESGKVSLHK